MWDMWKCYLNYNYSVVLWEHQITLKIFWPHNSTFCMITSKNRERDKNNKKKQAKVLYKSRHLSVTWFVDELRQFDSRIFLVDIKDRVRKCLLKIYMTNVNNHITLFARLSFLCADWWRLVFFHFIKKTIIYYFINFMFIFCFSWKLPLSLITIGQNIYNLDFNLWWIYSIKC